MPNTKDIFKDVCYFIEATSFESQMIFEKHHEKSGMQTYPIDATSLVVGYVGNKKKNRFINCYFKTIRLYDKIICFYDITGRYADHQIVRDFIKENSSLDVKITDANNFHLVLQFCNPN